MPSAPEAPDPVATAQAQGQMNKETAITQALLGMTNQVTPFGSLTYNQIGNWSSSQPQPEAQTQAADPVSQQQGQQATKDHNYHDNWHGRQDNRLENRADAGVFPNPNAANGSLYSNDGLYDVPRYEAVQTLTPDLQAIVDNYLSTGKNLSGTINDTLSTQLDTSGLPSRAGQMTGGQGLPMGLSWNGPDARYTIDNAGQIQKDVGADDWSEDRQRVEEALMSRLNPQLEMDRQRREADMRARGIAPGSGRAYDNAVDELNRQSNDARYGAILAGGQEQSRLAGLELDQGLFRNAAQAQQYGQNANDAAFFNQAQQQNWQQGFMGDTFARDSQNLAFNQNLAANQFNNSNRSGALEEAAFLRGLPINEMNALLSGTQIASPKFTNTPQPGVNGVDYTGLVNQQYQAQMANHQGMLGGLAGIGSSLIGMLPFSDRRLKRNVRKIGEWFNGLTVYAYDKFGRAEIGFMADEVAKVRPFAVKRHASGYDVVDYAEATR